MVVDAPCIHRQDDTLGSKRIRELVDEIRIPHRRRVYTHFVGASLQQWGDISDGADPAAHGKRNVDVTRNVFHQRGKRFPAFVRR
jgi:hypothetical protein